MNRFRLFSGKPAAAKAAALRERRPWRASEDLPLSLTAPRRGETINGQKALVLAFAAVAVAGGAYLGTMAMLNDGGAVTKLLAPSQATAARAENPAAPQQTAAQTNSVAAPRTIAAPANAVTGEAPRAQPTPTKVATIKVLPPKKPAVQPEAPAPETPEQVNARWANLTTAPQVPTAPPPVADAPVTEDPIAVDATAYAPETREMISEGVDAIMREMGDNKDLQLDKVASNNVASNEDAGPISGRQGRIRTAVNMRARPTDGSRVVGVIPTNAIVSVAPGCRSWCRVSFQGRSGYIYKGFLR